MPPFVLPSMTAGFAGVFALLFAGLSIAVTAGRVKQDRLHGADPGSVLHRQMRAQGNFAEYVPLILLLSALYEMGGGGRGTLATLLGVLLVARLIHPFGMQAPEGSALQFAARGGGTILTFGCLIAAGILLLVRYA